MTFANGSRQTNKMGKIAVALSLLTAADDTSMCDNHSLMCY